MSDPRTAILLGLLLLTAGLAGCLGDDGTAGPTAQPGESQGSTSGADLHEVEDVQAFEATAEDGTPLRGHVYLPTGSGPFAVVLEYSPYWNTAYWHSENASVEEEGRTTMRGWHAELIEAGFAVALVNVRGTGESGGCMQWGGPIDASDASTVVEALAEQPWSTGKVGMYGLSYPGWTQYMALAGDPPSLEAVVPVSGVIDMYSLTIWNGAPALAHPILTTYFTAGTALGAFGLSSFVPDSSPDHAACPRYTEDVQTSLEPVLDGDRMPYHEERDLRPPLAETDVPILATNGLTNSEGHIYQFAGLWDLIGHEDKRLLVGQWPHGYPFGGDTERFNEEYAVPWLDHHLRDGPELLEPGVVEYEDDSGGWHEADRWPPDGTEVTLRLSEDELAPANQEAATGEARFVSDDSRPWPDDCPGEKATFVSPPLVEDVVLAGNASIGLTVSSTAPDGNLAAHMWHLESLWPCPDGPEGAYAGGEIRESEIARSFTDLRHRGHLAEGEPFPVTEPGEIRVDSEPFASRIPAGDRLVLTVGGGDEAIAPDARKPVLTVHTGPDTLGEVSLTVVEGELRFEDAAGSRVQLSVGQASP